MTGLTTERAAPGAAADACARAAVELPTLFLTLAVYTGWMLATSVYTRWPAILVVPALILLLTLHSSLQHEILHGHPTRWNAFNRLLGMVPLSLWIPYERYRLTHRVHHTDERLTDPVDDPESYYCTPEEVAAMSPWMRGFRHAELTLAGRIVLGSWWRMLRFLHAELTLLVRNEPGVRAAWLEHLLWCVPVVLWLKLACGIPLWLYFTGMVIPANGILLIRSFAEHRARPGMRERIAIVENSWLLGPLFLFNNLHSLHHEAPAIPWYQYPARYRRTRARLIAENGGLVYNTYLDVARRFLFRPHDGLVHPAGRA